MSEMVERVMEAIAEVVDVDLRDETKETRAFYRKLARAAIAEMREPTDAMCDAAVRAQREAVDTAIADGEGEVIDEPAYTHWRAAIDEALK